MKNVQKTSVRLLIVALTLLSIAAVCVLGGAREDIVILYTSDVHCSIEENIGYAGLASYKALCKAQTPHVALVDCGDAVQGALMGTVSRGGSIVEIMNAVGYDFAVPGNHEFDYGMERLSELIAASQATYLACNLTYSGGGENRLAAVKPCAIVRYGRTRVAYIGVATPESVLKSTPSYFMEGGAFVYGFTGESGDALYARVQGWVDECRAKGADYVIVLSHLGDDAESAPFTSVELIRHTTGVDAVLDGHAHSVIPCRVEADKTGAPVLLSSTGAKLQNIGQFVITAGGHVSAGLISGYDGKDEALTREIARCKGVYEESVNTVVASTDLALSGYGAGGVRLVRNRETTIGDFCADAYRAVSGADIAFVNGGGIRADLPAGDITYADVFAVHPYGNTLCVAKVTGQEILDGLEMASRFTARETAQNGNAVGESGGFLQVSGLRYTIDTKVAPTVAVEENGLFVSGAGARRGRDVEVLGAGGVYEPLNPDGHYTLASHNYIIKERGDGMAMFADNELVIDEGMSDYQILTTYITDDMHGRLSRLYSDTDGRITVK